MDPDVLLVGRVVKPHGLRGELVVETLTDSPERFARDASLTMERPGGSRIDVRITAVRPHQGRLLVTLDAVPDRTAAERLRGAMLFIEAAEAVALPDGQYYAHQLHGLRVLDAGGAELGELRDVLENPANDLWVVHANGRDVLVPAVKEFIVDVDLEAGTIILAPPPGLF